MSVVRLTEELTAAEIYEHMAYDLLQDEEFNKKMLKELEMDKQASMTDEERSQMVINMFKSKGK